MTQTNGIEEAFVMTRTQLKEKQRVEDEESAKEEMVGAKPDSLEGSKEGEKLIAVDMSSELLVQVKDCGIPGANRF